MKVTEALRDCEFHFDQLENTFTNGATAGSNEIGHSVAELYETVQHCGNIIPRLYLLITVASTYIKSKRAPAKDILFDLVEVCRGVQHPMRGLFLRNYLSQVTRDKLPDSGSIYEGNGGTILDAIDFTLQNFAEMNKLWVRMQHQGAVRERARREKERKNLRQLVGTNLVRLSDLSGMTLALYREHVLPRLLDQIVDCRDQISQEYLMDCIIQVFPAEYHVETLSTFLDSCNRLHKKVSIKDIIITMIRRIVSFGKSMLEAAAIGSTVGYVDSNGVSGIEALQNTFPLFSNFIKSVDRSNLILADTLALQVALISLCATVHPSNVDFLDNVLGSCVEIIDYYQNPKPVEASAEVVPEEGTKKSKKPVAVTPTNLSTDAKSLGHIVSLLTYPLETFKLDFLKLTNYGPLLNMLDYKQRKKVATSICEALLLPPAQKITSVTTVDSLFSLLISLIRASPEEENGEADDDELDAEERRNDLEAEQTLVLNIFHLIHSDDTDDHFKMLLNARKFFGQGGVTRLEFTLPPIVYASLRLIERTHLRVTKIAAEAEARCRLEHNIPESKKSKDGEEDDDEDDDDDDEDEDDEDEDKNSAKSIRRANAKLITTAISEALAEVRIKPKRMFALVHETILALIEAYPEIALRLFVQCAHVADRCGSYEPIAYEFFAQAFITYENEISDSKTQISAFNFLIGSLCECVNFSKDNIDTLVSKATQYSSKLLIKTDQCRAAYNCAHLFWNDNPAHPCRNERLVLQCLQRALKVANACMGHQPHLFVEILNKYIYFYNKGCSSIELKYLRGLIDIIEDHLSNSDGSFQSRVALTHHKNTLAFLQSKKILQDEK